MKVSKIFASFAAAAVAASAMAISAFAAVTKVEPVKLNSKSEGDKIVQYDVSCIGTEKVTSVQIIGTLPADTWFGGGGAFVLLRTSGYRLILRSARAMLTR